jgi:hypothetical protein
MDVVYIKLSHIEKLRKKIHINSGYNKKICGAKYS